MEIKIKIWLQQTVKRWQAGLFCVMLVLITVMATYSMSSVTEQFQYENLQRQQKIVDKSVMPMQQDIRELRDRMSDSEFKIDFQVKESKRTLKNLDDLMYRADPDVLSEMARLDLKAAKQRNITQEANPTITVSPIINTGK